MKLTICNAHNFKLSKTGKSFVKGNWKNGTYFLFEKCAYCEEPYFSNTKNSMFCSNQCNNNSQKYSYNYVKNYIEKEDYQLLSDTYKNINTKLLLKCPIGHEYKVRFNNFKNGNRCPYCNINSQKHSYNYVKSFIKKEGYQLLSDNYENAHSYIKVKCNKGHLFKTKFNWFETGRKCPYCRKDIISKKLMHSYNYVKSFIEKEGYILLSETYKGSKIKLLLRCPKGHEYKAIFNAFQRGVRCPICAYNNISSKQEKDLQDYIEALGYSIIRNDRTQIVNPLTDHNLELDIWIPDKKKAIEYNGTYWHGKLDQIKKDKIKIDQCKQKGIDLLIVKEYNWTNNRIMEQDIIINWLNGKIYEINYV